MKHWVIAATCLIGSAHAAPVGTTTVIDRSVARVGSAVIWESDLATRVRQATPNDRPQILEGMIDDELIIAAGRQAGVTVEPSEVDSALDEIKKTNNLDDAGLDKALKDYGYSRARYRVDLERQLMILRTRNQLVAPRVTVTDLDIEAEAKMLGKPVPVQEPDKSEIQRELRRRALDAEAVKWIAELRKTAWIERRP